MSGHWLDVIGIGAEGPAGLSPECQALLTEARLVVGGQRQLALVADLVTGETVPWSAPSRATLDRLMAQRGRPPAVLLASGDPLWFGVGRLLLDHFRPAELRFHPHIGAFQLAAARLAWPLAETACLSLHSRRLDRLTRHLAHGRRLLVLTSDGEAPALIGHRLTAAGFGRTTMIVLENLGAADERAVSFRANEAAKRRLGDLNTVALLLEADDPANETVGRCLATGLPDAAFLDHGQLATRAIRAITLARLAPRPGQHLWDIGAGSGAIAIEWLLAGAATPDHPTTAVAIEASAEPVAVIIENAHRLGVPELRVLEGRAPAILPDRPAPDAVFIGGGLGTPGLVEDCLKPLRPGGRLVVNALTLSGEARLLDLQRRHGGDLARLAISRAEPKGRTTGWQSMPPVTQWVLTKGEAP